MMNKLSFVVGLGVGYVLGSRAGEKRYAQIKKQADKAWNSDAVQTRVTSATEQVKSAAPGVAASVQEKATEAAKSGASSVKDAAGTAKDKVSGGEDLPETIHRGEDGELHTDTSGFGPGGEKLP